jgi:hypothetical protein
MLLDSTTGVSGTAIDEHTWQGIGDKIDDVLQLFTCFPISYQQ